MTELVGLHVLQSCETPGWLCAVVFSLFNVMKFSLYFIVSSNWSSLTCILNYTSSGCLAWSCYSGTEFLSIWLRVHKKCMSNQIRRHFLNYIWLLGMILLMLCDCFNNSGTDKKCMSNQIRSWRIRPLTLSYWSNGRMSGLTLLVLTVHSQPSTSAITK